MALHTAQSCVLLPIPTSGFLQGQQSHVLATVLIAALTQLLPARPVIPALSHLVPAVSAIQLFPSIFQPLKIPAFPVPP
jgi:hypothetical protein